MDEGTTTASGDDERAFRKKHSEPGGIYARYNPLSPSVDPQTAHSTLPLTTERIVNRIRYSIPILGGTVISLSRFRQIQARLDEIGDGAQDGPNQSSGGSLAEEPGGCASGTYSLTLAVQNAVKHADHAIDALRLQGHHGQHRQGHPTQASLITVGPASLQALSPPPPQKEDGQDPTIKRTSPDSHGRPPSLGITAGSRTSGWIRRQNDCDDTQGQASPSNSTPQGGCCPVGLGEWHLRQRPQSRQ